MTNKFKLNNRAVGAGQPVYIIAEIGINHNGDLEVAKDMIHSAMACGVDAVKFQKRTPELCVPEYQKGRMRETPWGYISYIDYRHKVEFGMEEYTEIDRYCRELGVDWFASPWDVPSVDFLAQFDVIGYKVPSPVLTDLALLKYLKKQEKPVILSTGMSTMAQIDTAVDVIGQDNLLITHCTSAYPCPPKDLNLQVIPRLIERFDCPIGYSGHEVGLIPTVVAVGLGACLVERHFTLNRAMWGTDQAASVEPVGFRRLVKYIRATELALGDGKKKVYDSELGPLKKMRRVDGWQ